MEKQKKMEAFEMNSKFKLSGVSILTILTALSCAVIYSGGTSIEFDYSVFGFMLIGAFVIIMSAVALGDEQSE